MVYKLSDRPKWWLPKLMKWGSIGIVFYAAVFWMLSLAVDKIDQLVWLNASDEDREEILAKRKKKNA